METLLNDVQREALNTASILDLSVDHAKGTVTPMSEKVGDRYISRSREVHNEARRIQLTLFGTDRGQQ